MKFTKFGKALLMSALSAGVIFGVSSCVQSYTVGYLVCHGNSNGPVQRQRHHHRLQDRSQYRHLTPINGLPVSSGGANPVRAVLLTGSRFLYVLNRGVNAAGQRRLHHRPTPARTPTSPSSRSAATAF